jgi:hypothetical protein
LGAGVGHRGTSVDQLVPGDEDGALRQGRPQGFRVGDQQLAIRVWNEINFWLHGSIAAKDFGQGQWRLGKGSTILECGGDLRIIFRPRWVVGIGATGGTKNLRFIDRIKLESACRAPRFGQSSPPQLPSVYKAESRITAKTGGQDQERLVSRHPELSSNSLIRKQVKNGMPRLRLVKW